MRDRAALREASELTDDEAVRVAANPREILNGLGLPARGEEPKQLAAGPKAGSREPYDGAGRRDVPEGLADAVTRAIAAIVTP